MKKILSIVLTLVMLSAMLVPTVALADGWDLRIFVNGKRLSFPDAQPFVDANNRTQVPVRFVSEALNAKVEWVQATQTVVITKGTKKVELTIGKMEIIINGVAKPQDSAPVLVENRTFVPLRFVSEALGAKVEWKQATNSVFISLAKGEIEHLPTGKVDFNGFLVDVADGDDAKIYNDRKTVIKKSGIKFACETLSEILITANVSKNDKADFKTALTETEAVISQKFSAEKTAEVMEFLKKHFNAKKGNYDSLFIEDGNYTLTVLVSQLDVTITVRDKNLINANNG